MDDQVEGVPRLQSVVIQSILGSPLPLYVLHTRTDLLMSLHATCCMPHAACCMLNSSSLVHVRRSVDSIASLDRRLRAARVNFAPDSYDASSRQGFLSDRCMPD